MSQNHITLVVTVPQDQADVAMEALSGWGAILAIKRVGDNAESVGIAIAMIASQTSLSLGVVRQELEKRLRPFGGEIGGQEDWLLAAQALEGGNQ